MAYRRFAALMLFAPLALPASAHVHARLQGHFTMTGRITSARDVPGEHVGERVNRVWDFVAPCPAGQCATEKLVRPRAIGVDRLRIERKHRMFGSWSGKGSFYAPLRCGSRTYRRGERVRYEITVRITGAAIVNGVRVVTSVKARYRQSERRNRTPCFATLGHDAAVYTGTIINPADYPVPAPRAMRSLKSTRSSASS